jgi:predicted NACHT family NTPase
MILLMLAVLEGYRACLGSDRSGIAVPFWLTLAGWDPTEVSLREWIAQRLARDHPYLRSPDFGHAASAELLRAGRVVLFLDGLDEMPGHVRGKALTRIDED